MRCSTPQLQALEKLKRGYEQRTGRPQHSDRSGTHDALTDPLVAFTCHEHAKQSATLRTATTLALHASKAGPTSRRSCTRFSDAFAPRAHRAASLVNSDSAIRSFFHDFATLML